MPRDRRAWAVPGLLGALLVGYLVLPLDETAQRLWYNAVAILAMVLACFGLRVHRPAHLRGWVLVLAGFSGWVIGDLV